MGAKRYEIRVQGELGPDWAEWFDGMEVRQADDGNTILEGRIADQAALHGCLAKVQSLNLVLLSVQSVAPATPPVNAREKKEMDQ